MSLSLSFDLNWLFEMREVTHMGGSSCLVVSSLESWKRTVKPSGMNTDCGLSYI